MGILQADARHIPLPDGSVHCCVTSPPYWGLRDYGLPPQVWGGDAGCEHEWGAALPPVAPFSEGHNTRSGLADAANRSDGGKRKQENRADNQSGALYASSSGNVCRRCGAWRGTLGLEPTPELYVAHVVEVFREVKRVLRDDGTCWVNLGDSYTSGGRQTDGSRDAKQGTVRYAADSVYPRPAIPSGLKPKDLVGIPWRVAFALQADGWYLRSDIIWTKPNPMPESVTDRPTKAHEYLFLLAKRERYYFDQEAVREPQTGNAHARGFGDSPKGQLAEPGNRANSSFHVASAAYVEVPGGRNIRTVWNIATQPFAEAHFATFPEALVEPCIKAGTSERGCCPRCGAPLEREVEKGMTAHDGETQSGYSNGSAANRLALLRQAARKRGAEYANGNQTIGWQHTCGCNAGEPVPAIVLDPFSGSGTVGVVAARLGRNFVGLDLKADYCRMAVARIADSLKTDTEREIEELREAGQAALFA